MKEQTRKSTVEVIKSYALLKKGWDFGVGEPFLPDVINTALEIMKEGEAYNFITESFPETSGAITVAFVNDSHCLDISINSDLSIDIQYEVGIGDEYTALVELDNVQRDELGKWFVKLQNKS